MDDGPVLAADAHCRLDPAASDDPDIFDALFRVLEAATGRISFAQQPAGIPLPMVSGADGDFAVWVADGPVVRVLGIHVRGNEPLGFARWPTLGECVDLLPDRLVEAIHQHRDELPAPTRAHVG
ncbi:hypothetical protein [Nocardia sp. alder85J]|uniref:hypothetical protein n=1 Tax=Nocardia sp. alder85J TaxID=2862949 RepID=UPI001CD57498|nr:hypothetical protein [Nocardia sp. alder85J]MCX4097918.1 hypothetical protein [Nocardia sp. alder85J]